MEIYNYNPDTLELVSQSVADKDPLEEGNWLIPANATKVQPPVEIEGKTRHFKDGGWVYFDIPVVTEQEPAPEYVPTYADLRRAEYPPMSDYLDGVVKGDQAQIDKYIADCQAVKAKYPKPE